MSYDAKVVTIFISSPSDVKSDRENAIGAINRWNQRNGIQKRVFFSPLTWEGLVAPDIGRSGQDVINQQIGNDYDIFLGIMWSRFGTPTGESDSGTEGEFNLAVERYRNEQQITISFLFKTSPVPQSILDGIQYNKVQEFKGKISAAGCLYREFSDDFTFSDSLNLILDRTANQFDRDDSLVAEGLEPKSGSSKPSKPCGATVPAESELGLFDYQEALSESSLVFSKIMSLWGDKLTTLGEVTETATEELNNISRFGRPDPVSAKAIVDRLAKHLNEVSDWGEDIEVTLNDCMEKITEALSGLISVSNDFSNLQEDKDGATGSAVALIASIDETNGSLAELSSTMSSLPRLSKFMNRATRRLIELLDGMILKNATFRKNVEIWIGEI